MDHLDSKLSSIVEKVEGSHLSAEEKADVYAQISIGMRHLVWPIIVSHIPEEDVKAVVDHKALSFDRYMDLIDKALKNPETPKEIHNELLGALSEVEELISSKLPTATT